MHYPDKNKIKPIIKFDKDEIFIRDTLANKAINSYYVWGKVIKSEIILKNNISFNTELTVCEDTPFFAEVYFASEKIAYSSGGMYYYTQNRVNQATKTNMGRFAIDMPEALKNIEGVYRKYGVYDDNKDYIISMFMEIFIGSKFATTFLGKASKKEINGVINKYRNDILSIDPNAVPCKKWQKVWFKRFQKSVIKNRGYIFIKLMRLYRNIIAKPLKLYKK